MNTDEIRETGRGWDTQAFYQNKEFRVYFKGYEKPLEDLMQKMR